MIVLGREKQMELYADDRSEVSIANTRGRSLSISSGLRGVQLFFIINKNRIIFIVKNIKIQFLAERKIIEMLCNRPIDINLKDYQGVTAIMIAAKNGIIQGKIIISINEYFFNIFMLFYRKRTHS